MAGTAARRQTEVLVRLLATRCGRHELLLVPNACAGSSDATTVGETLGALASRPPHVPLERLGWIPYDDAVIRARRARCTLHAVAPGAPAAQALAAIAGRIVSLAPARPTGAAQFFFQSLIAQGRAGMMPATGSGTSLRLRTRRAPVAKLRAEIDREEVLRRYLPLVRRVVQRIAARKPPHIDLEDLVSWGIVGLLDAMDKYDPRKEALFSTYAQFRIRGAVLDHLP